MNEADFVASIRKVWFFAKAVGVDAEFSVPTSLQASDEFKQIATDPSASYEELFLAGIRDGQ